MPTRQQQCHDKKIRNQSKCNMWHKWRNNIESLTIKVEENDVWTDGRTDGWMRDAEHRTKHITFHQ